MTKKVDFRLFKFTVINPTGIVELRLITDVSEYISLIFDDTALYVS